MAVGDLAGFKGRHIILEVLPDASAPENSMFISQSTGELKFRQGASPPVPIGSASSDTLFLKTKQNSTPSAIPSHTPVSLKADGTIIPTDSDDPDGQQFIGYTREIIAASQFGIVGLVAPNYTDTLSGKGFTSGQEVFMDETSGQIIDEAGLSAFTGDDDSIVNIGVADCASGVANSAATDLISINSVLSRP